nr:uncharacterized protein LOC127316206 [Lolium perenne]
MSSGDEFDLSDSSSSDESDLDELLQDDEMEATMLLLSVKDLEDRAKLLNRRRGSVFGRNHIQRNRLLGHEQLMEDYFAEVPTYPPHLFRRRYLMRRSLFVRIVKACELHLNYFKQRRNATGVMGFSSFQKISAAMRVIAYGIPADYTDEYLRIGEDTTTESVRSASSSHPFCHRASHRRSLAAYRRRCASRISSRSASSSATRFSSSWRRRSASRCTLPLARVVGIYDRR